MDSESIDNDAQQGAPAQAHWPHRVDWRTGKITYSRDAEFWGVSVFLCVRRFAELIS